METVKNDNGIEKELSISINRYWEERNYSSVLNLFKILFLYKRFDISFLHFTRARSSYRYMKDNPRFKNYWAELTPDYMIKSSYLVKSLANQSISMEESMEIFSSIMKLSGISSNLSTAYTECFSLIANAVFNNKKCIIPNSFIKHNSHVICSGLGWSGSGAVIDYLREFSNMISIRGESQLLESTISFLSLVKLKNNTEELLKKLLEFFFITIIGAIEISNHSIFKILLVRKWLFNDYNAGVMVLSQYYIISSIIANMICNCRSHSMIELDSLLRKLGDEIINLISANVPNDKIPILDNCIHIQNLGIANYLSSVKVVAVHRDPRSIFVTRCLEDRGFTKDVAAFVSDYKRCRKVVNETVFNNKNTSSIIIISFEDFVMNENKRVELQQALGISLGEWKHRNKFFNENISIKNVFNFNNFENQDQITLIEKDLKDFLFPFEG